MLAESTFLTLPVRGGHGEETCREILRAFFGSADGQVRFLGTAPEEWPARDRCSKSGWHGGSPAAGAPASAGGRVQWLPFGDLLAAAGSPVLRDPRTLAALTVAARSDILAEWTRPSEPQGRWRRRARPASVGCECPIWRCGPPSPTSTVQGRALPEQRSEPARVQRSRAGAGGGPERPATRPNPVPVRPGREPGQFFMVRVDALKRVAGAGGGGPLAGVGGLAPTRSSTPSRSACGPCSTGRRAVS